MTTATTRRALISKCAQLQQQLDASGHESRVKRAKRLLELQDQLKTINNALDKANERIIALEAEALDLQAKLAAALKPAVAA